MPAGPGRRLAVWAINLAAPVLLAAGAALAAAHRPALAWAFAVAAAATAAMPCVMIAATGRSWGHVATGTRTVLRETGVAAMRELPRAFVRGALGTFDLRRGRDPFAPALAPFVFPTADPHAPPPGTAAAHGLAPMVLLDSGERFSLVRPLVLGRSPAGGEDDAELYRWADLSRTLSKAHARLEWDGMTVWVTDLGSTNGTAVRSGRSTQELVPHRRTGVPTDATLVLGERLVTVRRSG